MSLFGTFRRTKGKKNSISSSSEQGHTTIIASPGAGNLALGLDVNVNSSIGTSNVFSSTPNLYRIDNNNSTRNKYQQKKKSSIDVGATVGATSVVSSSKWSFENRRTHSSIANVNSTTTGPENEIWTGTVSPKVLPPPTSTSSSSTAGSSSLRHFKSMLNVMGSLKRSKSIRKLGWGSSVNVSKEVTSSSSVVNTKSSSNIKPTKSSSKTSKSEEFLNAEENDNDVPDFIRQDSCSSYSSSINSTRSNNNKLKSFATSIAKKASLHNKNTEPGVISSGSSSENSSIHDNNSIRACSEKSDLLEEDSDEELMEKTLKDPEEIQRKKLLLIGTKKFNMDAKKGIDFLVGNGIIRFTKEDIARFLKDGYGLSKASIGNYLGERNDFNEEVLKSFVELHDFKNLILVQALREFLWGFRLPGESQKISRMLDAFAERYCQNNPELFSIDTCSVLCYSIIMLNTELHNPNVKEKVTLDQFIKRNRGIEGGELLSPNFMNSLYNSIQTEPFRFPEEDGNDLMLTFFNPDYEGWLYKLGGRPKSWTRLWFILSNNCLYFFKFTTDKTPLGIIPLENILVRVPPEKSGSKLNNMVLYKESPDPRIVDYIKMCKTLSDGQTVPKSYSTIQLATPDRKERERWVRAINANHSMSNFYSELTLKKMKAKLQSSDVKKVVRKSQISLPATVLPVDVDVPIPIPQEVLNNSMKDPQNFFKSHNVSSISLENKDPALDRDPIDPDNNTSMRMRQEELQRSRSKSEGKLYENSVFRRSKSKSPSVISIPNTNLSLGGLSSAAISSSVSSLSIDDCRGDGGGITLRTDSSSKSNCDKSKKLSMICERMRSESNSSAGDVSQVLKKNNESFKDFSSCSSSSNTTAEDEFEYSQLSSSSKVEDHDDGGGGSVKNSCTGNYAHDNSFILRTDSDFMEMPLLPSNTNESPMSYRNSSSCNTSLSKSTSELLDNSCTSDNCSVQIIDCSKAEIKGTITTIVKGAANKALPEMFFESIYESNV